MAMTIDEAITNLMFLRLNPTGDKECELEPEAKELFDVAIETMRKYQKLEQEPTTKNDLALLEKTYADFCNCEGGEGWLKIDGKEYATDAGYALEGMSIFMEVFKRRLAELPSVTPQLSSGLEKNSKKLEKNFGELDCISRADVLKLMKDNWHTHNGDWAMQESMDDIRALPSVTPIRPKGHWIVAKGGSYMGVRNACCSNCKNFYTNDWKYMNYCPNCSADMREVEK